jgi:hypothetical protein
MITITDDKKWAKKSYDVRFIWFCLQFYNIQPWICQFYALGFNKTGLINFLPEI